MGHGYGENCAQVQGGHQHLRSGYVRGAVQLPTICLGSYYDWFAQETRGNFRAVGVAVARSVFRYLNVLCLLIEWYLSFFKDNVIHD